MKIILLILFSLVVCSILCKKYPGFKASLTQKGLDYAKDVSIKFLESELVNNIKIPDVHTRTRVPVLGEVDVWVTSIKLTRISFPHNNLKIIQNQGFNVAILGVSGQVTFRIRYKQRKFPRIGGSHNGVVTISRTNAQMNLKIVESNGKVRASVIHNSFNIDGLSVKLSGGAAWILNLVIGLFKNNFKRTIQNEVSKSLVKAVNVDLNQVLAKLPTKLHIHKGVGLDYSMVQPKFQPTHLTLNSIGEFYDFENRKPSDHKTRVSPDILDTQKHITLVVTDYLGLTAWEAFHKKNVLNVWLTDDMIPEWSPVRLTTNSFRYIIPALYRKHPDTDLKIHVKTIENGQFHLNTTGATLRAVGEMSWYAKKKDSKDDWEHAFTTTTLATCSGKATLNEGGDKIISELKFVSQYNKLTRTDIGEFSVSVFDTLMNMLFSRGLIPAINLILAKGIPLPTIPELKLVNPSIIYREGVLLIQSNIKLNLNQINEYIK